MNEPSASLAHGLPKILLHEHLDGGLRPATLLELLRKKKLPCPADTPEALAAWFDANAHAGSLEKYLEGFALTVAAMADLDALWRVALEAAEDSRLENALLGEFRIAPLLFEPYGLNIDHVVDAMLIGLSGSPLISGLIVCGMRHLPPEEVERAAALAIRWKDRGVIGFDLAGAEFGHPPEKHARALAMCREAGLALTLHAGEADGPERVVEAARLGARRIGHGVALAQALADPARRWMVDEIKERGVHLEVCPTSNVHTGAARSVAEHPIRALWDAGVSLSFNTDNRLMSRISQTDEAEVLIRDAGFTPGDLLRMSMHGAKANFIHPDFGWQFEYRARQHAEANGIAL